MNNNTIILWLREMLTPFVDVETEGFDKELIMHANKSFAKLRQLGAGPYDGFIIESGEETWSDFSTDKKLIGFIQEYVYIDCRLVFDPPQSSQVLKSLAEELNELSWRIVNDF